MRFSGDSLGTRQPLVEQPAPLLGRQEELDAVCQQLLADEVRLLTLTGPAGIGKTALALAVARELGAAFAHGAWVVDLAPLADHTLVLTAIAQTLGVHDAGSRPLLEALQASLRDRHLLLVLDNFEHLLPAAPQVPALLAVCPRLKVLVTSRERLSLRWERTLAVPPLPLPASRLSAAVGAVARTPSVALFLERTRAIVPGFELTAGNAPAVAEICTRLDGLPLAIELAAARANVLAPAELLERLPRSLAVLQWRARDVPLRHQTLRDAIGWSYDLLAAPEQALFRRLAAFAGGFTLAAAEEVADASGLGLDILDGISSLVDKSLVQPAQRADGEPWFRLLETIREFALEQLAASGDQTAAQRRHALYYLALAEKADAQLWGAEQRSWLERLTREHDNLRAALAWSQAATSDPTLTADDNGGPIPAEVGLRIAVALTGFWRLRGHVGEGRRWLEAVLASHPTVGVAPVTGRSPRVRALTDAGFFAQIQNDHDTARTRLSAGLTLAHELGDRRGIAWAHHTLGRLASAEGDHARAAALYEESLPLFRDSGDALGHRLALVFMGNAARDRGDYARAAELFEQSLALFREAGDTWNVACQLLHRGRVAYVQGDYGGAAAHLAESLRTYRTLPPLLGLADCLDGLSWLVEEQQPERAARLAGATALVREAVGHAILPSYHAESDRHLAALRAALGEAAFEAAWAEGQSMSLDQAIEEALAVVQQPAPAAAVAARTGAPRPPHHLSEREHAVLRLLADGLSNREIAQALVISEATAKFHVHSILNKLGANTRGQAVALAVQQGLV